MLDYRHAKVTSSESGSCHLLKKEAALWLHRICVYNGLPGHSTARLGKPQSLDLPTNPLPQEILAD